MSGGQEVKISSVVVLRCWFDLWNSVGKSVSHKDWTKENLIEDIVSEHDGSVVDIRKAVEDRLSQSFRYARNKLIAAHMKRHLMESKENDLLSSKLYVTEFFESNLRLRGLMIGVRMDDKGKIIIGRVDGWGLPDSKSAGGRERTDWVGEFSGYLR